MLYAPTDHAQGFSPSPSEVPSAPVPARRARPGPRSPSQAAISPSSEGMSGPHHADKTNFSGGEDAPAPWGKYPAQTPRCGRWTPSPAPATTRGAGCAHNPQSRVCADTARLSSRGNDSKMTSKPTARPTHRTYPTGTRRDVTTTCPNIGRPTCTRSTKSLHSKTPAHEMRREPRAHEPCGCATVLGGCMRLGISKRSR
jgi:hypothetical protein